MGHFIDLVLLSLLYFAGMAWFSNEDPERARRRGRGLTADFAVKSRWFLDKAGMKWIYKTNDPQACVGSGDPPHPVVDIEDWMSPAAEAAFADALVAMGQQHGGFPLAPIHAHAPTHLDTAARNTFPGVVGTRKMGCPGGSTSTANGEGCLLRPRCDVEWAYFARGGEGKRSETPDELLARLQRFRLELSADSIMRSNNPVLAAFFQETHKQEGHDTTSDSQQLNRFLLSGVKTLYSDSGPATEVRTTKLIIEAMLPWMEVAAATDPAEFEGVRNTTLPPWLKAVLRHSCRYESRRYRTVKGFSWWPSTGAAGLGQTCDGACESASDGLRGVYYLAGPRGIPRRDPPSTKSASMVLIDPQTVIHSVESGQGKRDCLTPRESVHHFPSDARLLAPINQAAGTLWQVVNSKNQTILEVPTADVSLRVTWEGAVFESAAKADAWTTREEKSTVTIDRVIEDLFNGLRDRGALRYREHLADAAERAATSSASDDNPPSRLRKKLAHLLVTEHEQLPEPRLALHHNRCVICGAVQGISAWFSPACEAALFCSPPAPCPSAQTKDEL